METAIVIPEIPVAEIPQSGRDEFLRSEPLIESGDKDILLRNMLRKSRTTLGSCDYTEKIDVLRICTVFQKPLRHGFGGAPCRQHGIEYDDHALFRDRGEVLVIPVRFKGRLIALEPHDARAGFREHLQHRFEERDAGT